LLWAVRPRFDSRRTALGREGGVWFAELSPEERMLLRKSPPLEAQQEETKSHELFSQMKLTHNERRGRIVTICRRQCTQRKTLKKTKCGGESRDAVESNVDVEFFCCWIFDFLWIAVEVRGEKMEMSDRWNLRTADLYDAGLGFFL